MKFIFNKKSEFSDRRFIRLDGSIWDSKGLGCFVSRTENQITLLGALGVVAFTLATEGRLDIVNSQILHNAGAMVVGSLGVGVLFDYHFVKHSQESPWNKIIDTEGRSFPSKDLKLGRINSLKQFGIRASGGTALAGALKIPLVFLLNKSDVSIILFTAMGLAFHISIMTGSIAYRCHKLIKGHSGEENGYIITDDTPSKKGKSKDSVFSFLKKCVPSLG